MGADTKRVEAAFEGASTCIDGYQFAPLPDAPHVLVSEPLPVPAADRLCTIPGFRPCAQSDDVLRVVDEQLQIQKVAARRAGSGGPDIGREVEELRRANHNQAQEIDLLREERDRLSQRLGSGDLARVSAERMEALERVKVLEQELATLAARGPDVTPLLQERDRLRAEVERLTPIAAKGEAQATELAAEVQRLTEENEALVKQQKSKGK